MNVHPMNIVRSQGEQYSVHEVNVKTLLVHAMVLPTS